MDQTHIKRQLGNLHTLLQFIDAELANYLGKRTRNSSHISLEHGIILAENNASNMYFFFRWMLICFKREFAFNDVMHLWEVTEWSRTGNDSFTLCVCVWQVIWTDHICKNFELLVCLAILISQKTVIMESKFGCNEILKVSPFSIADAYELTPSSLLHDKNKTLCFSHWSSSLSMHFLLACQWSFMPSSVGTSTVAGWGTSHSAKTMWTDDAGSSSINIGNALSWQEKGTGEKHSLGAAPLLAGSTHSSTSAKQHVSSTTLLNWAG